MIRRLIPALVLVVVTASCALTTLARYRETRFIGPGPRVLVVGDSNAAFAGQALDRALRARYTASIDAQPGITTGDARWNARLPIDLALSRPQVVVVQLGTNDASPAGVAGFPAAIDRFMRALPAGVPVLWSDVRVLLGVSREWVDAQWTANVDLVRATARWPNLHVLDYARHFAGHPDWVAPTDVHLTPAGDEEYARWIAGRIAPFKR